jgi:hypothetical protein
LPDHVAVSSEEDRKVGEGCYISTTVHNRRYYGVLVDQATLKAASMLYFQDEAVGIELNRKMERLARVNKVDETMDPGNIAIAKRKAETDLDESLTKRARSDVFPDIAVSSGPTDWKKKRPSHKPDDSRPVQKFRYVSSGNTDSNAKTYGYRELIATYVDVTAAADDDPTQSDLIETACRSGGNFVGQYYYQYEVSFTNLEMIFVT